MNKSLNTKTQRKTITTTLKDGSLVTLHEYDRFKVHGEVAYSHFMTPLSPKQIEHLNELRDQWAASEEHVGPYYHDNPNVPYGELTIKNVSIINRKEQPTAAELFAVDHFFESITRDSGIKKMTLKNHVATIATGIFSTDGITQCTFDDELAPGNEVVAEAMIYFTKFGRPAIALTGVYSVGDPAYLDRSQYKKRAVAA